MMLKPFSIAIDNQFVKQASVCRQLEHYKLDSKSIIEEVEQWLKIKQDLMLHW